MIELSIVYSMWNPQPRTIEEHLNTWRSCPEELRKRFEVIYVDDHSTPPVKIEPDFDMNLTVARIKDDIYWNICGAKNLGCHIANGSWLLTTDQDHLPFDHTDIERAIDVRKHGSNTVYFMDRLRPDGSDRGKVHPNSFIVKKDDFWRLGGYDEDFSGNRGFSDHMIRQQMAINHFVVLAMKSIRLKEYKEFTCKDPRNRNFGYNGTLVNKKMNELRNGTYKNGPILRFDWEIVSNYGYNISNI